MAYETFPLRFEGCGHVLDVPLQHSPNHNHCFVCQPDLRDVPAPGECPPCIVARDAKERAALFDSTWFETQRSAYLHNLGDISISLQTLNDELTDREGRFEEWHFSLLQKSF
jgi:hypothetical protein